MPVDRHVIRRVGEDHPGLFARHQRGHHAWFERIATDQTMRPELPNVTRADTGGCPVRDDIVPRIIRLLWFDHRQSSINLRDREACEPDVEVEVRGHKRTKLGGEHVFVPAGVERKFVVGKDIGALLVLAHVIDPQTGHLGHAQQFRRGYATVAGQDRPRFINQHRVREAELTNAGCDLPDLLFRVGASISCPGGECRNGVMRDLVVWH